MIYKERWRDILQGWYHCDADGKGCDLHRVVAECRKMLADALLARVREAEAFMLKILVPVWGKARV